MLVVGQVELEAFGDDALFELGIEDGESQFDALEEIAFHPVGAGQVNGFLAAGQEVEDPVVFEEAADDGADADVLGEAGDAGTQGADATDAD